MRMRRDAVPLLQQEVDQLRHDIHKKNERILLLEAENSELKAFKGMYQEKVNELAEVYRVEASKIRFNEDKKEDPKPKKKPAPRKPAATKGAKHARA